MTQYNRGSALVGVVRVDEDGVPVGTTSSPTAVGGNVASGAADSGNPVKIGGIYRSASNKPTLTDGQRGDAQLDVSGNLHSRLTVTNAAGADGVSNSNLGYGISSANQSVQVLMTATAPAMFNGTSWDRLRGDTNGLVTQPYATTGSRWQYAGVTGGITDTADVALAAAAGASIRNYLVAIQFLNTAATASEIVVKDGSTVIWRGYAAALMTVMQTVTFSVPLKGTANTALNVAMITTATATRVSAQGFTGA